MIIKFIDINDNEHSWDNKDILGLKKVKVFGTNRVSYFIEHNEGIELEISSKAYSDFLAEGFSEL